MQEGFKDLDSKITALGNFTFFKETFSECAWYKNFIMLATDQ